MSNKLGIMIRIQKFSLHLQAYRGSDIYFLLMLTFHIEINSIVLKEIECVFICSTFP